MLLVALTKSRFVLDEDSYLVPELDGVRIFSRHTHEFLHEVPGEAPQAYGVSRAGAPDHRLPYGPMPMAQNRIWVLGSELRILVLHFY